MLIFNSGGVVEEVVVANEQPLLKTSMHMLVFNGGSVVEMVVVENKQRRGWRLLNIKK